MEKALIERLAQLRGIGEAYQNYRGELQHFSLETKAGILSAMGCAVDDDEALTAEIAQLESVRSRKFLPAVATARSSRIGFDINVTAREFGGTILWRALLEDGTRLQGSVSSADLHGNLARRGRKGHGSHAAASNWLWICRPATMSSRRKLPAARSTAAC